MRWRLWLIIGVFAVIAACGGDSGSGVSSPCDLADAELVESVFGGTVAPGVEGEARNCDFAVEGGPVFSVAVFHYGRDDEWESTRQGFVDNRSGVTDVEGIGDDAFFPGDFGARELIVRSGGEIFSVTVFTGFDEPSAQVINAVADLSKAIADGLSS